MGSCLGCYNLPEPPPGLPHSINGKIDAVKLMVYGLAGILFFVGIAALIVGSIASIGALPIALTGLIGASGAVFGSIAALPGLLQTINNGQKMTTIQDLQYKQKATEELRKACESEIETQKHIISAMEYQLKCKMELQEREILQSQLNDCNRRLEELRTHGLQQNRNGMMNSVAASIRDINHAANTEGTAANSYINSRELGEINKYCLAIQQY